MTILSLKNSLNGMQCFPALRKRSNVHSLKRTIGTFGAARESFYVPKSAVGVAEVPNKP
jgi:hypothetical protein